MPIQPNKAIVGANSFAHESGIHQDGMLKNKSTYEIISPEILGIPSKALVLGKHSGRNAFKTHLDQLIKDTIYFEYIQKDPKLYEVLFATFKKLADTKKSGVSDQDLFTLLDESLNLFSTDTSTYFFKKLYIMAGSDVLSTATVTILINKTGQEITDAATGNGAVNAIFNAINRVIGNQNLLYSFDVKALSEGSDSPGQVVVRIKKFDEAPKKKRKIDNDSKDIFTGRGVDDDILIASAKAYINAVNRMINDERRYLDQETRNVDV